MDSIALLTTHPSPPPPLPSKTPPKSLPISSIAIPSPSSPPLQSHSTKPRNFSESDAFPDSLPLHSKNPHVLYKDIQRFARLGKLREALTILDYLEHRGIPINSTTFASLLAACSRAKSLSAGRQVHVHLRINGLENNEFLLTKLVEMYATCGSTNDANRVFRELAPKSVFTWNALLHGVVVGGRRWGHGPATVFMEMREAGVDVNEYTFSCLLKSFGGSPALTQGMKTHAILIKSGFAEASLLLRTGLIDMYFKCGKIRMAMRVFDEIPERDVVLWGAVIAGFAHNRLQREALEYLRWMGSEGFEPNSVIATTILPVIGELSKHILGREIHGYVLKKFRDYHKLVNIQSGLIDMYCKCGDMVSGRRVFYGATGRNVVSWTALMSGYASNGRFEQALRSIVWMQQEGVKPDVVTIATILPVCARLKALRQGKEIHGYGLKSWFFPNVSISTSLMKLYSECGNLDYSLKVFKGIERKNIIAWTALIDSYSKDGHFCDALEVFRLMKKENYRTDAIAIARILSSTGALGAVKLGKEIHGQVLKLKLESVPFVIAEAVNMYGTCGDVESARRVFNGVQSKGSLTCTSIIGAYGSNGRYKEAIHLYESMSSKGYVPNHFTFDVILRICDKAGYVDKALEVFDSMVRMHNLKPSEEHCSSIIGMLTRKGRVVEAQRFIYLKSTLVQASAYS